MSGQKANTVLDLAQRFRDGRLSEAELRDLPDDEAIGQLTAVKGVGPWTAKGALLIALQRPDLVPHGDRSLQVTDASRGGAIAPREPGHPHFAYRLPSGAKKPVAAQTPKGCDAT